MQTISKSRPGRGRVAAAATVAAAFVAGVSTAGVSTAVAQDKPRAPDAWPAKPVRMIVPFAPGGPTDLIARIVGTRLGERLGQTVIVDNRPGAGGNIGILAVAKAPPDGYTLLFSSSNIVSNPALTEKPPFDPLKDFVPITYAAVAPNIVYVNNAVPAKNAQELVALIRSQPGKFSFGSPGAGTTPHVACEALRMAAGLDFQHVPYNGAAPVLQAVLGNQVPIGCTAMPPTVPHVKSGAIRAIAVTTAQRTGVLPDVPTFVESGFPDVVADNMQALLAPAGTPREIALRVQREVAAIFQEPEPRAKLQAAGFDLHASTPEEFTRIIQVETARYAKIMKAAGIKGE